MTSSDLETATARYGHRDRLGWLTSDANPDPVSRALYRRLVADLAADKPPDPEPAAYPPLVVQAGNAAAAAARFLSSGCDTVDQAEHDRRRAVCASCPNLDRDADRCRVCACFLSLKPWSRAERCPEGRWEAQDAR